MVTRRAALAMAAAPLAWPIVGAISPRDGLQDLAGRAGMLFGAAVTADALASDPALRDALDRQCGVLIPELELKWAWVQPQPGRFAFDAADRIANFAQRHGKRLHGHTLLWHDSIPGWAAESMARPDGWQVVERHVTTIVARYAGIETWDVVNEPIAPDPSIGDLRPSPLLRAFGDDYVDRAFHLVRNLAPRATLFLNEFGLEYDGPFDRAKRAALLGTLDRLAARHAPIDGIGLQSHLDLARDEAFSPTALAAFLNELGGRGLQVRISELDVKEADRSLSMPERDRRVADSVRRFLDVALDNRAVGTVACWGLSDRHSWLNGAATTNRGLPLDAACRPKPMFDALATALARREPQSKRPPAEAG